MQEYYLKLIVDYGMCVEAILCDFSWKLLYISGLFQILLIHKSLTKVMKIFLLHRGNIRRLSFNLGQLMDIKWMRKVVFKSKIPFLLNLLNKKIM